MLGKFRQSKGGGGSGVESESGELDLVVGTTRGLDQAYFFRDFSIKRPFAFQPQLLRSVRQYWTNMTPWAHLPR